MDRETIEKSAEESEFNTRHASSRKSKDTESKYFDARSLRRTNRTSKLNIAVKSDTRERFWNLVQEMGFESGEDGLLKLIESCEKKSG